MPDWLGKTIGKVRIEKLLARGGMAEVYRATHPTLKRVVAIKLMREAIQDDPMMRLDEFRLMSRPAGRDVTELYAVA